MKKLLTYILPLTLILSACGPQKNVVKARGEAKEQALTTFYAKYDSQLPKFKQVQIKSKIHTDMNGKNLNANLRLYIKNQERIWANASILGITGARINITPSKVQGYSVLSKEYIDSNFDYFNDLLKVNFITYDRLQQLLLGQLFLIGTPQDYSLETTDDNQYILSYDKNAEIEKSPKKNQYIHNFYLDSNYRLRKVEVKDPTSQTNIEVTYDEWQKLNDKNFPSFVKISINGKQKDLIELDYTNFVFEENDPPFNIPSGYKEKKIN
uniref:DUF4292 domain-containing protein n=1 Tax=Ornithobacterium rhinotracheale TaxID=28251 RepID=UPI00129CC268|nr:DUF4292 domain-containing protein [Ornithobacterium rhinotracheale]